MSWALRMRWLWLEKTNPNRPWALLNVSVPTQVRAMFKISIVTNVGDGRTTTFWTDRWIHGQSIEDLAPTLMSFVRRRGWQTRTVQDAIQNNSWTRDISGGLSVLAVWQMIQLGEALAQLTLDANEKDQHCWLPESSGHFTSKSAYERFHTGAIAFEPYRRIWRTWAPLKAKVFLWLASWRRCWTADRLQRRGLPHPQACPLCDQDQETIDHVLLGCIFAREIWFNVLRWIGL